MSDEFDDVQADISNSLAAELTGTLGVSDDAAVDQPLPDRLADDVDDYDRHAADKDLEPEELVEEDEQQQTGGKVPLGALQKERTQRQQAQDHARELEQQNAQLMQQLAQFQQYQQQQAQAQQQQAQQEAVPEFEDDPKAYFDYKERQFTEQLQAVQYQQQFQHAAAQLQQERQQLAPVVIEAEQAFAESVGVENYHTAFDAVHQAVQANMRQQHPNASPQEMALIEQAVNVQFVRECQARGINPAEHIYNRAIEMGYTPNQRVPNSSTRQMKTPPTSLSSLPASGRAPDETGKVSARDIANMSVADFDKLFDSMRDAGTQRPAV
ncbi:hypothetical protein D3C84_571820 [compost metagenome]